MPRPLFPFPGFMPNTPVLPKLYWEAITPEQELHELCKRLHTLFDYAQQLGTLTAEQMQELQKLQAEFEKFKASGFEDYYAQQLEAWINANVANIFNQYAKLVLFGLSDDGHFVAYVPESWSDIWFDTIATYEDPNYGCLVICWDGDGQNLNPQGPSSNHLSYEQLQYKPKINGVTLSGDKSFPDLGLIPITTQEVDTAFGGE